MIFKMDVGTSYFAEIWTIETNIYYSVDHVQLN